MHGIAPKTTLHSGFSDPVAQAVPWETALEALSEAEIFWLSTVRPDGRPHVTPLIAVWVENALHFCTGEHERKRLNLSMNAQCILTTGCNGIDSGMDLVIEGKAVRVISEARLQEIAETYEKKYGSDWHFDVTQDGFQGPESNVAWVFRLEPTVAFGFSKGTPFGQTRWSFVP